MEPASAGKVETRGSRIDIYPGGSRKGRLIRQSRVSLKMVQTRSVLKKFRLSRPIADQGLNIRSTA
jgi:hypothetical protein